MLAANVLEGDLSALRSMGLPVNLRPAPKDTKGAPCPEEKLEAKKRTLAREQAALDIDASGFVSRSDSENGSDSSRLDSAEDDGKGSECGDSDNYACEGDDGNDGGSSNTDDDGENGGSSNDGMRRLPTCLPPFPFGLLTLPTFSCLREY
jgi:hypothetical protein